MVENVGPTLNKSQRKYKITKTPIKLYQKASRKQLIKPLTKKQKKLLKTSHAQFADNCFMTQ